MAARAVAAPGQEPLADLAGTLRNCWRRRWAPTRSRCTRSSRTPPCNSWAPLGCRRRWSTRGAGCRRIRRPRPATSLVPGNRCSWPTAPRRRRTTCWSAVPARSGRRAPWCRSAGRAAVAVVVAFFVKQQTRSRRRSGRRSAGSSASVADEIVERLRAHPHQAGWITDAQSMLDAMPGAVGVSVPIRDPAGEIVDWVLVAASPEADRRDRQARAGAGRHQHRDRATRPSSAPSCGTRWPRCWPPAGRVRSARSPTWRRCRASSRRCSPCGSPGSAAACCSPGAGTTWSAGWPPGSRRPSGSGRLGWGEWDLTTGGVYWSAGLYAIFQRDPEAGPPTLEEAAGQLHPQDAPRIAPQLARVFERRPAGRPQLPDRRRRGGAAPAGPVRDHPRPHRAGAQGLRHRAGRVGARGGRPGPGPAGRHRGRTRRAAAQPADRAPAGDRAAADHPADPDRRAAPAGARRRGPLSAGGGGQPGRRRLVRRGRAGRRPEPARGR